MSLILCPECGAKISNKATVCPHCGFQSSDSSRPISEQDNFEIIPDFQYDIEEWNPTRRELLVVSSAENKSLIQYFGNWENIKIGLPTLAETIKSMASREKILVADMDPYIKSLIDKGIYRFTVDKTGKILPTIRDSKKIVKQVRLKELTLPPDLSQFFFHLTTIVVMAKILDEIDYFKDAIREIHIELQNNRLAMTESAIDQFLQARKIQDAKKREIALLNVVDSATKSKRALMRNFSMNLNYIKKNSQKSMLRLVLPSKGEKDITTKSYDAIQDLVSITNAVQIECESYSMLGEYGSSNECLNQFKKFILDNKLDERDTLLLINECLVHKHNEIVDSFSDLSIRITSFDATQQIENHMKDMLTADNENKVDEVINEIDVGTEDVHSCEECGSPLTSTNKYAHCEYCRRKIASDTRIELLKYGIKVSPYIVKIFSKKKL